MSPRWTGGNALATLFGSDLTKRTTDLAASHVSWGPSQWAPANLMKVTVSDGSGE